MKKNIFMNDKLMRQEEKELEKKEYEDFLKTNQKCGTGIISVHKIEERQFYDSTWRIFYYGQKGIEFIDLVRGDSEKRMGICRALECLNIYTRDVLRTLDQREQIYYD